MQAGCGCIAREVQLVPGLAQLSLQLGLGLLQRAKVSVQAVSAADKSSIIVKRGR